MTAVSFLTYGFDDQLVRILDQGGAPWFVAADVCACIGLGRVRDCVSKLDEDEKMTIPLETTGGVQRVVIISESGLYTLIFRSQEALSKDSPAWRFRRWVTGEVLPALRTTGRYEISPANDEGESVQAEAAEMDERRIMLGLAIVREARMVFGRHTARQLWDRSGLPSVDKPTQQLMIEGNGDLSEDFLSWAEERTVQERGARMKSQTFYQDYCRWSHEREINPMSVADFGNNFRRYGYPSFHSNGIWRVGIRLGEMAA